MTAEKTSKKGKAASIPSTKASKTTSVEQEENQAGEAPKPLSLVISIATHKGGAGKTTTTINLADALAREGFSVLVVDMDNQANTTVTIGEVRPTLKGTIGEVLTAGPVALLDALQDETSISGVHLIGSSIRLTPIEEKIRNGEISYAPATVLQQRIAPLQIHYDFILIDTPPSLGMFTVNSLAASDYYILPVESGSKFGMDGIDDLMDAVVRVQEVNTKLKLLGCLVLKHDARMTICNLLHEQLKHKLKEAVFKSTISNSTKLNQANGMRQSVLGLDRRSRPAREYVQVAREILERLNIPRRVHTTEIDDE